MKGILYLVPNIIAEGTQHEVIPQQVHLVLKEVKIFLAEDIRTARRYLSSLKISVEPLSFHLLNKDTNEIEIPDLMRPLHEGNNIGVISESGCPGVADPGARAVAYAHANDIRVIPLVGPSSLLLSLMASGLNGQQFAFHGYLPINAKQAADAIRIIEKESKKKNQTQIFIETPYRNNALFELMLKTLQKTTLLTVAIDVTGKQESIRTQTIAKWQSLKTTWPKQPAVFLFCA